MGRNPLDAHADILIIAIEGIAEGRGYIDGEEYGVRRVGACAACRDVVWEADWEVGDC